MIMETRKNQKQSYMLEPYNNRELSWIAFNKRVLEEAIDLSNPLLERLKFLAIFSSNLDEFFMVRVAGLKDQVSVGYNKPEDKAKLLPKEQLREISRMTHTLVEKQYQVNQNLLQELAELENITITTVDALSDTERLKLEHYFIENILPVLTPMAIDAYHPFPMLMNKSFNLAVELKDPKEPHIKKFAIIQIPALLDRFVTIEGREQDTFLLIEDIVAHFAYLLFHGYQVESITEFRITRNADLTIHEEGARDLLQEIVKELKNRKHGAAVRLEVNRNRSQKETVKYLLKTLEVHSSDLYMVDGPIDLTFLFRFYSYLKPRYEHLVYEKLVPQQPMDIHENETVFEAARKRDVFLHHPFESFDSVVELVTEAANDPSTLAIKQTLYRVSGNSPIIKGLKQAAENGKQVTVLVELKARFDEENNIQWAKELEKAGCHVIYGMSSLKTHSKITLIVRKSFEKIERIVHLGTGNYNDDTAKLYTDMGIITTKRKFGIDATNFFNYLSGVTEVPTYHHLSMAPVSIKTDLIKRIDQEIELHKKFGNGCIIAKMNSLTNKPIIDHFYKASQAGVKIHLIVRGICCLKPGMEGISENITVRSIVGRFLEHTRIYYFHSNGDQKVYLSSADLMTRNLDKRVELLFPIYENRIKDRIMDILSIYLKDNVKAREQFSDGHYEYVKRSKGEALVNSQISLYEAAYKVALSD